MNSKKSLFLDSVRIIAASLVFYGHSFFLFYGDTNTNPYLISNMRHFAVVLFFVISGYVIGFTTSSNNRGVKQYAVARLSRIYSMLFPTLIFSFLIDFVISLFINNNEYFEFKNLIRYIITGLCLNEFWFFSSAPKINGPLWSISFEFFFYFIFGFYFFIKDKFAKYVYTILACFIAGVKILLMFPIWISGYLAFILEDKFYKSKNYFIFFSFLFLTYLSYLFIPSYPYKVGYKPFYFANQFITDFINGFLFACSIIFFPDNTKLNIPDKLVNQVRKIADYTFPIYILHYPLLLLCKSLFHDKYFINIKFYLSILITLLFSILLGKIFNQYRIIWSKYFEMLITLITKSLNLSNNLK